MFGRRNIAAIVAEFLGTGVLTLLVLNVQRSTIGVPFFVALAAGLAVIVLSFAVAGTSGGHFNPALTFGLWTARKVTSIRAVLYIGAQFLGGWAAYGAYTYFTNNTFPPVGGKFSQRVLIAEAAGAFIFAFGWSAAMYQRFSPAVRASIAGLSLSVGIIAVSSAASAANPVIGILNPAEALGLRAWVLGSFVAGPVIGAILGVNLYKYLFAPSVEGAEIDANGLVLPASVSSASVAAVGTTKASAAAKTTTVRKPRAVVKVVRPAKVATAKKTTVTTKTRTKK
jgi:aquaporin Z